MCLSYNLASIQNETIVSSYIYIGCANYYLYNKFIFNKTFEKGAVRFFKRTDKFLNKIRIGYKVYEVDGDQINGIYAHDMKVNRWFTADDGTIDPAYGPEYLNGFHILWNRKEARDYLKENGDDTSKIFKVEYKDVTALGFDAGRQVVIAKKMRILGKV